MAPEVLIYTKVFMLELPQRVKPPLPHTNRQFYGVTGEASASEPSYLTLRETADRSPLPKLTVGELLAEI